MKPIISKDEHAKLPDALKGEYVAQADGRMFLVVEPHKETVDGKTVVYALEDVAGLKSALAKQQQSAEDATKLLEAFKDLDPAAAREALKKVEKMKDWTPDDKVKEMLSQRLGEQETRLTAETKKEKERADRLQRFSEELLVDSEVSRALSGKASIQLLLPHIKAHTRVIEKDGRLVARVVNADGTPIPSYRKGPDGKMAMTDMGVEEFALSLKEQEAFAPAFFGTGHTGPGGVSPASGAGKGGGRFTMPESVARDNPREYQALRTEANKVGQHVELIPDKR